MEEAKIRSRNNRFCIAYSLRNRYLAVTGLVILLIITASLLAQFYVKRASEVRSRNIELRTDSASHIRLLRSALLDLEKNLYTYLQHPNDWMRIRVHEALIQAISRQKELYALDWFKTTMIVKELDVVGRKLEELDTTLVHLMDEDAVNEHSETGDRKFDSQSSRLTALLTATELKITEILGLTQQLDDKLERQHSSDLTMLEEIAETITHTLWLLALLGLVLVVTALIYFERNVLAPITQVAKALRAEAHGQPQPLLPDTQSSETHNLIEAFTELRQQVQQRQQSLEHLALHDTLTGIANREQLVRSIQQSLNSPYAGDHQLALILIGLNRFKEINNSLGHGVGDRLLVAVAKRLNENKPENALLARVMGDGFALLLSDGNSNDAVPKARAIFKALEAPFEVEKQSLYISATLGIALSPEHGSHPLELLQKAEVAMQAAKQQKLHLTHYNSEYDRHAMRRLALANALREELLTPQNTLSLVYQPQIEVRSGKFYGMEALLRWSPSQGMVAADELIPIAEQTGLIYQLTPWVLERAFEEFSSLKFEGTGKPVLAINLSALNLQHADFPHKLEQLMEKWAIEPSSLELEITESAMMADPERAHRILGHIHSLGIDLTIDDFGTGFSSLTYLKHLPVNKLKIDRSFVASMLRDENDAVIIRSTIDMAHNLGLLVVAEGVENQETYDLLEILDCDYVQGYLLSSPLDIAAVEKWSSVKKPLLVRPPLHAGY